MEDTMDEQHLSNIESADEYRQEHKQYAGGFNEQ